MSAMVVRYQIGSEPPRWGRLVSDAPSSPGDEIIVEQFPVEARTTSEFIEALDKNPGAGERRSFQASALLSPVTSDATLVCQGLNYGDHAQESGHHVRRENLLFGKASSSLSGPYDAIVRPAEVELLDFEVEIGLVLRKELATGVQVTNDNVGEYVAGVVLCNDVSARDIMFGAGFMQWYRGKSYRTFCPAGPVLYLLDRDDAAAALENLEISLAFNGKPKQAAVTAQMIYKPAETLTEIATVMDLSRGDMVLTGTPGGVLAHATPQVVETLQRLLLNDSARRAELRTRMAEETEFLKPGDVLELRMRDSRTGNFLGAQVTNIACFETQ